MEKTGEPTKQLKFPKRQCYLIKCNARVNAGTRCYATVDFTSFDKFAKALLRYADVRVRSWLCAFQFIIAYMYMHRLLANADGHLLH